MSDEKTEPRRKARGDDQGGAWEINDEQEERSEGEGEHRSKGDTGKAWSINENTADSESEQ